MNRKGRLQQQQLKLQTEWDTWHEKLAFLREQLVVETRPEERFRLQKAITDADTTLLEVEYKLDNVEGAFKHIVQSDYSRDTFQQARVFISYKRDIEPDETVALQICETLGQTHNAFIDQKMLVGTLWAAQLESELQQSDFLITLLSAYSIHSEMVLAEIEMAHHLAQEQGGQPIILPVRLAYREPFKYPLSTYLDPLNWAFWRDQRDTPRIIAELKRAIVGGVLPVNRSLKKHIIQRQKPRTISEPLPIAQPIPIAQPAWKPEISIEKPEGTIKTKSEFYIERQEDTIALRAIQSQGVTITIKAPRQMGKSSLLMRIIEAASQLGKQVAFLNFQLFDKSALNDADTFYNQFCMWLSTVLKVTDHSTDYWQQPLGNNQRCTLYMTNLLETLDMPLVLAMDEVDNIFSSPFRSDFFGMLRTWHNQRAFHNDRIWQQLDLALVTSTEPYQLIENLNQSPFNVGEIIELPDFTLEQIEILNQRHHSPFTSAQLKQLLDLLAGHPYLTRRALYLVATQRLSVAELFAQATADRGPFGDHLRHHAFRLHNRPKLIEGLRQVLYNRTCQDDAIFFRLRGAGLIQRPAGGPAAFPRCQLYADFFKERLHG